MNTCRAKKASRGSLAAAEHDDVRLLPDFLQLGLALGRRQVAEPPHFLGGFFLQPGFLGRPLLCAGAGRQRYQHDETP